MRDRRPSNAHTICVSSVFLFDPNRNIHPKRSEDAWQLPRDLCRIEEPSDRNVVGDTTHVESFRSRSKQQGPDHPSFSCETVSSVSHRSMRIIGWIPNRPISARIPSLYRCSLEKMKRRFPVESRKPGCQNHQACEISMLGKHPHPSCRLLRTRV